MPAESAERTRRLKRVETLIRVLAPFLDAVLFVGDRVSRVLEREDKYVTPRMKHGGESAPRGLRPRA